MSKSDQIKAIRGMNDILPADSHIWRVIENACASVLTNYGYSQIRTPIVESTKLFARSIGAETDIVSKEMYTFEDRNGDSLTLRPEGTASCVRAGIEHGLFYNQQQRLWYIGPMFRHERPQKGRYRQFNQLGAECYGWETPDIEAEVLAMTAQIFSTLGLTKTNLQINSLGDAQTRANYRQALIAYLKGHRDALDEDSLRRMATNPLRILDTKNPQVQEVLRSAPSILDFLSEESASRFEQLQAYLKKLQIDFQINSRLVRGLDYYNDTVFEWVNEDFGAQATVCAGGRYDGMVEQLGGTPTSGFGFALGLERLIQILSEQESASVDITKRPDVFIISDLDSARSQSLVIQQRLTHAGISVQLHCGAGSLKNQFKKANKSGAKIALILGEDEAATNSVSIKPLISTKSPIEQKNIVQNDVLIAVTNLLESL
jgi:histidyl-tRNA synthetase